MVVICASIKKRSSSAQRGRSSHHHSFFLSNRHQQMSFGKVEFSCKVLRVMFAARSEWLLLPRCEESPFQP